MIAEQRKLPGESNIHWFPECSSVEHDTRPFTGGLAPNRFQKTLRHAPKTIQKIFPSTIAQPGAILVHPSAERIRYTNHGSEQKPKIR